MHRDSNESALRRWVPGLARILVEVELIAHSLLRVCDYVDGRRGVVIRRAVWAGDERRTLVRRGL